MNKQLHQVTRTYQNHVLDSTRWQHYQPRADDIVVSTSYKSGTTWQYLRQKWRRNEKSD